MKESANTPISEINSIAVIGNYMPRQCGIATFTTDLVESLKSQGSQCQAVAINDDPEGYDYPEEVHFEINETNYDDYLTAANFLNINRTDVICLQHEFGIFGGTSGDYILKLLQKVQAPVVTTLHTVLVNPSKAEERVMNQLIELSERLVVMSKSAVEMLNSLYDIPKGKIAYIPHGIPDLPFVDPNYYKDKYDLLGKNVLLTFGLISENKGIEYVINALPDVIEQFPDLTYVVLGATHPKAPESKGKLYREKLERLVEELGLENHVIFKNQFVPYEELCDHLAAADLYITPYIKEEQITSGTLAYASGTGKAVISTPYWYAKEMLADERGVLVPFKDAQSIRDAILDLFENDAKRHQMRKRAYDYNRKATWHEVAQQYLDVFHQVTLDQKSSSFSSSPLDLIRHPLRTTKLPSLKLDHLQTLTDGTGMLQHSTYTTPNRDFGYCTDDNARALLFTVQVQKLSEVLDFEPDELESLSNRYLSFLVQAYNSETGYFRNFMNYSREWLESRGSKDSHSRALWSLGIAISLSKQSANLPVPSKLFMDALSTAESFDSPRSIAFTLIGINAYLETFSGDSKAHHIHSVLAERLFKMFKDNATDDWPWLEDTLTYSNGKLPHALLVAGKRMQREDMIQMGLQSLDWLMDIQTENGHLEPVGNQGWYPKGGNKASFDQQPLEAHALIEACIVAYDISDKKSWLNRAILCFNWFLGYNSLNKPLYDSRTGGCRDGLESDGVNQNEGAESTLAWLLSLTAMYELSEAEFLQPSSKMKSTTVSN